MDITSLIIGLGLFVLFMFPIVYVLVKQNSKERKQAKALKKNRSRKSIGARCDQHLWQPRAWP